MPGIGEIVAGRRANSNKITRGPIVQKETPLFPQRVSEMWCVVIRIPAARVGTEDTKSYRRERRIWILCLTGGLQTKPRL